MIRTRTAPWPSRSAGEGRSSPAGRSAARAVAPDDLGRLGFPSLGAGLGLAGGLGPAGRSTGRAWGGLRSLAQAACSCGRRADVPVRVLAPRPGRRRSDVASRWLALSPLSPRPSFSRSAGSAALRPTFISSSLPVARLADVPVRCADYVRPRRRRHVRRPGDRDEFRLVAGQFDGQSRRACARPSRAANVVLTIRSPATGKPSPRCVRRGGARHGGGSAALSESSSALTAIRSAWKVACGVSTGAAAGRG